MPDADFRSPAARRKRQKALNAEYEAIMGSYRRNFRPAQPVEEQDAPEPNEPAPPPQLTTIYFVQGVDGGPVKIGLSDFPEMRLNALQMASPIKLVIRASIMAERSLERDYHARFAAHRLHGEWFSPHPDILAEIEALNGA